MKRRDFLDRLGTGAAGLGLLGPSGLAAAGARSPAAGPRPGGAPRRRAARPNIVLIMADDMGFSDIGSYGGEIDTPNLDRLAAGGIRFSHFYNAARCCPTRASLLTGLYNHQAGVGHMMAEVVAPGYIGQLNDRCVTVAEVLRDAGYRTGMSGKWHLSHLLIEGKDQLNFRSKRPFWDTKATWPAGRGFEEHWGTIPGVSNFFDPYGLVHNETLTYPETEDFYYTDAITDHACDTIERFAREGDQPFFLYVAHVAPHWPLHALPEDVEKYRGRYSGGWDRLRAARYERLLESGMIRPEWALTPRDESVPPWTAAENREWEERRMEVYAAQVDRMDQGIGRVMDTLRRLDLAEDTLVLFLSDNGACEETVRQEWYDIPSATRDGRPIVVGNDPSIMPGPETTWQSYGPPWANAGNTPWRLYKHWVHEGGIAAPFIAHWPAGLTRTGQITHDVCHVMDVMATCLDVAGVPYPRTFRGRDILPLEGLSFAPLFTGAPRRDHEALFWEHEGHRAVRAGRWKLVTRARGEWELYDMEADRSELNDLAARHPDKVRELRDRYRAWAERAGVIPWPEYVRIRRQVRGR